MKEKTRREQIKVSNSEKEANDWLITTDYPIYRIYPKVIKDQLKFVIIYNIERW